MSRSTQYIGLNDVGENCIVGMEEVETDNHTNGMFDEKVPLGEWHSVHGLRFKEVQQFVIWSSGPMIFTCLENQDGKRYGEWKRQERTPIEYSEYDDDTGIIWI